MGLFEAFVAAIEAKTGGDLLAYTGVWAFSPLLSHTYIRLVVNDRDRRNVPEMGMWSLLGIAILSTFTASFVVSSGLAGWPLDKALKQAVAVAIAYPMLLPFLLKRAKTVAPDVVGDLGELPTEFRAAGEDRTAPKP